MRYIIYLCNGIKSKVYECDTLKEAQVKLTELENNYSCYRGYLFIETEEV